MHGIPRQVRIPRGRLHLAMAEQAADHRQAFPERQRPRRERVPEVVNSQVAQEGRTQMRWEGLGGLVGRIAISPIWAPELRGNICLWWGVGCRQTIRGRGVATYHAEI